MAAQRKRFCAVTKPRGMLYRFIINPAGVYTSGNMVGISSSDNKSRFYINTWRNNAVQLSALRSIYMGIRWCGEATRVHKAGFKLGTKRAILSYYAPIILIRSRAVIFFVKHAGAQLETFMPSVVCHFGCEAPMRMNPSWALLLVQILLVISSKGKLGLIQMDASQLTWPLFLV